MRVMEKYPESVITAKWFCVRIGTCCAIKALQRQFAFWQHKCTQIVVIFEIGRSKPRHFFPIGLHPMIVSRTLEPYVLQNSTLL